MKGSCRVDMALIKDFSQIIALCLFINAIVFCLAKRLLFT